MCEQEGGRKCEGESREKLHDGAGGLCVRGEVGGVMWFWAFFPLFVLPLCLQLEAHPDFVSAGVEVLPVDQS